MNKIIIIYIVSFLSLYILQKEIKAEITDIVGKNFIPHKSLPMNPKVIEKQRGVQILTSHCKIYSNLELNSYPIELLRKELEEKYNLETDFVKSIPNEISKNSIVVINNGKSSSPIIEQLGIHINGDKEAFTISTEGVSSIIASNSYRGVLYAIRQLLSLIEGKNDSLMIPKFTIQDWPSVKKRWVMLDPARWKKKQKYYLYAIKRLSEARVNGLVLHLTDYEGFHLPLPSYPELLSKHSFTINDLKELVSYGEKMGVEIIPSVEVLGHISSIVLAGHIDLTNPLDEEKPLTYKGRSLDPFNSKTVKFIEEIVKTCSEIFPSIYIHVALDEVSEDGLGNSNGAKKYYRENYDKLKKYSLYESAFLYHIENVRKILKRYNKEMIMYQDLLLNHPHLAGKISKDIILEDWHYYNGHWGHQPYTQMNKETSKFLMDNGYSVIGVPALACTYFRLLPQYAGLINVKRWVEISEELNLLGIDVSVWDKNRYLDDTSWFALQYSGAVMWEGLANNKFNEERFVTDYLNFNFGIKPNNKLVNAFLFIHQNAPDHLLFMRLMPPSWFEFLQVFLRQGISIEPWMREYLSVVNNDIESIVEVMESNKFEVRNRKGEYEALLLAANVEKYLGDLGKFYLGNLNWPLTEYEKGKLEIIKEETSSLLKAIITKRDEWCYPDDLQREGKQKVNEWNPWFLVRYFYDFQTTINEFNKRYVNRAKTK